MASRIHYTRSMFSHYTACGINISSYGGWFRKEVKETMNKEEATCKECIGIE